MILEMFPEPLIALREEINYHPDLQVLLLAQQDKDVYIQISEIAAYCGIVLDGMYTRDDMIKLCDMMVRQLQNKRAIIVLPLN